MTAVRVIENHDELEGIGSNTHPQIDSHIQNTQFAVVSGSYTIPPNARVIKAGTGILITDTGAQGELIISVSSSLGSTIAWMETPSGSADGTNIYYGLQHTPYPATALMFYVNGILQLQGANNDYTLTGSNINLNYIPRSGSNILATYPYLIIWHARSYHSQLKYFHQKASTML